jgi:hypothetical protein
MAKTGQQSRVGVHGVTGSVSHDTDRRLEEALANALLQVTREQREYLRELSNWRERSQRKGGVIGGHVESRSRAEQS